MSNETSPARAPSAAVWGAKCALAPAIFLLASGLHDGFRRANLVAMAAGLAVAAVTAAVVAQRWVRALSGLQAMFLLVAGGGSVLSLALSLAPLDPFERAGSAGSAGSAGRAGAMFFGIGLCFLVSVSLALQVLLQHRPNRTRWNTLAFFVFAPGLLIIAGELFDSWRRDGMVEPRLHQIGISGAAILLAYGVSWTSFLMAASPPRGPDA